MSRWKKKPPTPEQHAWEACLTRYVRRCAGMQLLDPPAGCGIDVVALVDSQELPSRPDLAEHERCRRSLRARFDRAWAPHSHPLLADVV